MKTTALIRVLAFATLLTAACGTANLPAARNLATPPATMSAPETVFPSAQPTPSPVAPSPTSTPTQAPVALYLAAPCNPPSDRRLALVTLRGSNQIVVRDITDMSHPSTASSLRTYPASVGASDAMEGAIGQFVCETQVSYVGGGSGDSYGLPTNLYRAPLPGSSKLVIKGKEVFVFAWSRDGTTLLYVAVDDAAGGNELHELRNGVDRVIASLPGLGVGGCEYEPCPGPFQNPGDKWDMRISFSPDGTHFAVVQWGIEVYLRIWSSNGKLVSHSDSLDTSMSIWAGSDFYFRDQKGVERWHNGTTSTFLPGVVWIRPKASADGRQIVYAARDAQHVAHVFIVDTATGAVRDLGKGRAEPAFLSPRYVWDQAETTGFPGIATGKTYVYDLQTNTESSSVITSVVDVWPHAA
jgi:hypothetical protein